MGKYDVDRDGAISLDEFCQFILSRNALHEEDVIRVDHLVRPSSRTKEGISNNNKPIRVIDMTNNNDDINNEEMSYKAKIALRSIKSFLLREATDKRNSGQVAIAERLGQKSTVLIEKIAREVFIQLFRPHIKLESGSGISSNAFFKVLLKCTSPGSKLLERDISDYLFTLSCQQNQSVESSVNSLLDLIFDKGGSQVNQFGFVSDVKSALDVSRPEVGTGPFKKTQNVLQPDRPHEIGDVPLRVVTRKSRTALPAPTSFHAQLIEKSAKLPPYQAKKDHVFGLKFDTHSGSAVWPYPELGSNKIIYSAAALGIVHDLSSNKQYFFEGHSDDISCITVAAGS